MSEETEVLIGGLCDGLVIRKINDSKTFAGRQGDGVINVYVRQKDGRLHFSHSYNIREVGDACRFEKENT